MTIDMTLTKTKIGDIYKTTKNNEPRTIKLIPMAIDLLKTHYTEESRKRKRLKIRVKMEKRYLFTNQHGDIISEGYFRREWEKFCKEHDFEYKPPYDLRHSTATLLAYNKIPKANISEQLGHLNRQTTEIYIHAVDEVQDNIEEIMSQTLTTNRNAWSFFVGDFDFRQPSTHWKQAKFVGDLAVIDGYSQS